MKHVNENLVLSESGEIADLAISRIMSAESLQECGVNVHHENSSNVKWDTP